MTSRTQKKRMLKTLSIAAIVVILAAVGISYLAKNYVQKQINLSDKITFIDEKADLALGQINQTSTKDGRDEWNLKADVATFKQAENLMGLDFVTVTFFFNDGDSGTVTADKGFMQTQTQNFGLYNNVRAQVQDYVLTTDRLDYDKATDTLASESTVFIRSKDSYLQGDRMWVEVQKRLLIMEGNVRLHLSPEFLQKTN